MAKPTLGKPPNRPSEGTADPTTEMFSRWMRETEAIDDDSTGEAPRTVAPPRGGRHLAGITGIAGVVVVAAVVAATFLWPNQLQQLMTGSSAASRASLSSQQVPPAAGGASSTASPPADGSPSDAASALPAAPSEGDPASAADALTPAREYAGQQLTENSALRLSSSAETLLIDGQVDARLILVLALLLSDHTLSIADFPQGDGSVADLRNSVVITELDGADLATNAQARVDATSLLLAFAAPAAPSHVTMTDDGILARFDGPEPPGLLPTPAPSSAPTAP